jgi:hypothetical protein
MAKPPDELARSILVFTPETRGADRIVACKAFLREAMADLRDRVRP